MIDRPRRGERAMLLYIRSGQPPYREERSEFQALANSAGAELVGDLTATLRTINPRFLIGTGKLDELKVACDSVDAELVVFNPVLGQAFLTLLLCPTPQRIAFANILVQRDAEATGCQDEVHV